MKLPKFKRKCNFNGKIYKPGQILKISKNENFSKIWNLNEKGYIEPLSEKEFLEIIRKYKK